MTLWLHHAGIWDLACALRHWEEQSNVLTWAKCLRMEYSRTSYVLMVTMNLSLDAKFMQILEGVPWAQGLPHMLNVPHGCQSGRICNPRSHWNAKLGSVEFCHFDYIVRGYVRIATCNSWSIWKPLGTIGQKQGISPEVVLRWLTSRTLLEESPDAGKICWFFVCKLSRFWLRNTKYWELTRV